MTAPSPLALALLPAAGAVGIGLTGRWPNLREAVTLLTAAALFVGVLLLAPAVLELPALDPRAPSWRGPTLVGGLSLAFRVEPLGLLYALVAAGLWLPNSLYSIGYMRGHHEQNQTRFYVCFALALASVMGIAFADNLFTLFLCYEALSVVTYPLVTHHGSAEARRAGRIYLGFLFGSSMSMFLLAIIAVWALTGSDGFAVGGTLADLSPGLRAALLVMFVLGIGKAAVMPLHFWLPAAMVAPTPVSALLHAVAVVKAGVFCVLKVAVYVFGVDGVASAASADLVMGLAAATVVIASLVALYQDNLKARLAYSTVGQLGYIVLGAALGTKLGIVGGGLHIATHAFGKITLFFAAGAIYVATGKTRVSELDGLGRAMPITFACFALGALSIIGLPPLGGAWSKWYLALGALDSAHAWLIGAFLLSSLLNVAYLLPIPMRAFFLEDPRLRGRGVAEAPWPCVVALVVTALGAALLFFFPDPIVALLERVVA